MKRKYVKWRKICYDVLESHNWKNPFSLIDDLVICLTIFASIIYFIVYTMPGEDHSIASAHWPEYVFAGIFSIELALRVWACVELKKYSHPFWGRLRYCTELLTIIDICAILPFFLTLFWPDQFAAFHSLQILRLFHILKMARYFGSLRLLGMSVYLRRRELGVTFLAAGILLIFVSSMMFFVERDVQPQHFGSIPDAMWWGVVTLTTVGYGDIYPITGLGKFLAAILAFVGIGIFALPAGIIAGTFADALERKHKSKKFNKHRTLEHATVYELCRRLAEKKLGDSASHEDITHFSKELLWDVEEKIFKREK